MNTKPKSPPRTTTEKAKATAKGTIADAGPDDSVIHLISEPEFFARSPTVDAPHVTPVPRGVSTWDLLTDTPTRLPNHETGIVLEPHTHGEVKKLLIANFDPDTTIYINDLKISIVALAGIGDILRTGSSSAYEVAHYHRAAISSPSEEQIGRQCPVCLTVLEKNSRIYSCPCGSAMHLEEEGESALKCALVVGNCTQCQKPILLEDGYYPEPEFLPHE